MKDKDSNRNLINLCKNKLAASQYLGQYPDATVMSFILHDLFSPGDNNDVALLNRLNYQDEKSIFYWSKNTGIYFKKEYEAIIKSLGGKRQLRTNRPEMIRQILCDILTVKEQSQIRDISLSIRNKSDYSDIYLDSLIKKGMPDEIIVSILDTQTQITAELLKKCTNITCDAKILIQIINHSSADKSVINAIIHHKHANGNVFKVIKDKALLDFDNEFLLSTNSVGCDPIRQAILDRDMTKLNILLDALATFSPNEQQAILTQVLADKNNALSIAINKYQPIPIMNIFDHINTLPLAMKKAILASANEALLGDAITYLAPSPSVLLMILLFSNSTVLRKQSLGKLEYKLGYIQQTGLPLQVLLYSLELSTKNETLQDELLAMQSPHSTGLRTTLQSLFEKYPKEIQGLLKDLDVKACFIACLDEQDPQVTSLILKSLQTNQGEPFDTIINHEANVRLNLPNDDNLDETQSDSFLSKTLIELSMDAMRMGKHSTAWHDTFKKQQEYYLLETELLKTQKNLLEEQESLKRYEEAYIKLCDERRPIQLKFDHLNELIQKLDKLSSFEQE